MKRAKVTLANGFSVVELVVVLVVIAFGVVLLLKLFAEGVVDLDKRSGCQRNLKQAVIALNAFAQDHDSNYPWCVISTNSLSERGLDGNARTWFQPLSNHLGRASALTCLADQHRKPATSFATLQRENISYFLNLDATTNNPMQMIVFGDRNLRMNGKALNAGLVNTADGILTWTGDLHKSGGNLAFADGHVEWKPKELTEAFRKLGTNWLVLP
jgi:prepilin-type processing-associated H-X9-DG protein